MKFGLNVYLNLISLGEKGHLKTYMGSGLQSIEIVSPSDGHQSAERSFLYDFPRNYCVAGHLRRLVFLPNPKAVFCSFHAFKIDLVSHTIWRLSIPAGRLLYHSLIMTE